MVEGIRWGFKIDTLIATSQYEGKIFLFSLTSKGIKYSNVFVASKLLLSRSMILEMFGAILINIHLSKETYFRVHQPPLSSGAGV